VTFHVKRSAVALLVTLQVASVASAQPPAAQSLLRQTAWAGRQHEFTGDASSNDWVAGFEVAGPLPVLLLRRPVSTAVTFQMSALPDRSVSLADPTTWGRSAELRLAAYTRVGTMRSAVEEVTLDAGCGWGFVTALEGASTLRYARSYGCGFRLATSRAGSFIEVFAGRHEWSGPLGRGQILLRGSYPVGTGPMGTDVVLQGDAALNVSAPGQGRPDRRDIMRLSVVARR